MDIKLGASMPRSQSAMEYLMTYGWSILFVAVVITVLFALGVFNTANNSGLSSCVPLSGYQCNNPILYSTGKISFHASEIGSTVTIVGAACTTGSSPPSTIPQISPSITIGSGQQAAINATCSTTSSAIGTKFTGYLWIQYSTGVVVQIARVTTTITALASGTIAYVPVNVVNGQSSSTGSSFQQQITFNPSQSAYSANEASDLGNIRFYQGNSELYSWCETGCTSSSSSATFWVLIPGGIGANSNIMLNMTFMSTNTEYDGAYAGEAPQLSSSYGKFDNGASVFYWYLANPTSSSGWTVNGAAGFTTSAPGGSYFGTTNAFYAQDDGNTNYMYTSVSAMRPNTIITYWNYVTSGGGCADFFFLSNSIGGGQFARIDERSAYPTDTGILPTFSWTSWTGNGNMANPTASNWDKVDLVISSPTTATMYVSSTTGTLIGTLGGSNSGSQSIGNNGIYIGFQGDGCSTTTDYYWNGFVERAYPPSGTMPSVSFGSIVP
jgi:hypothetical protein